MARPGPDYKISNSNQSSFNLIAHNRHGVPDSPLYGMSPRRQADYRARPEEDIAAVRDREIKLVRGVVKPDYRFKNDTRSSYDLISGIPTRKMIEDPDFNQIRQREMEMAARSGRDNYPREASPPPGSPIKTNHRHNTVPFSPLYRPGQGHDPHQGQGHQGQGYDPHQGQGYDPHQGQGPQGQGYDPRDDPGRHVQIQTPERPISHGRDAEHRPPNLDIKEAHDYSMEQHNRRPVEDSRYEADNAAPVARVDEVPPGSAPPYRPGQGKGLVLNDPRTGSPVKGGRMPWSDLQTGRPSFPPTPDMNTTKLNIDQNEDDDTKLRLNELTQAPKFVKVLDEFRDHRGNAVIKGYPPESYRSGYGLSSDRNAIRPQNAAERQQQARDDMMDPRYGGAVSTGPGLMGSRNGGALLFIKFPVGKGENIRVASHAFLKAKTHDCGGRYLGMAPKVYEFGYERGPQEAVAVFHFPSREKALLFFQIDYTLRQPDFPPPNGHAEMWIVCNAYLPDNMPLFNTFLLSEVQLHGGKERREFFETFQVPFENYLYKNGAMPFVICSYGSRDRQDVRRHCYAYNSIVTCHLFQGIDHLNWITNEETYSKFRSLHNQMATEKCSIFKLSRDTGL